MIIRQSFAVGVIVSGVIFACTSGTGGSGGPSDSSGFTNQFCDLFAPCCGKVNKPTDGAACKAFYGAFASASTYDAAKGGDCLAELRAQQSSADFCQLAFTNAPSCNKVFKEGGGGTKAPGEDCSQDGDCASSPEGDVECASVSSNGAETKACQVEIDGKPGDMPCVGTRDGNVTFREGSFSSGGDAGPARPPAKGYICDVAKGSFCDSKTKACTKIEDVGGACDTSNSTRACVKTAFCDSSTKKCVARLAIGADCSKSPSSCVEKASCDNATKTCVAGLAAGMPCTTSSKCESNRCVNGKCEDSSAGGDISTQFLCGN